MKIDGEALARLFLRGAPLEGATIHNAELYGENYADGSADGCEILFVTKRGGLALLSLDAFETDGLAARFISTDAEAQAEADEADRRRIAELEQRAAEIRAQYPALQAIHAAAQAEAARSAHTLDD